MKKILIIISLLLSPQIVFWNQNELDNIEITIQNKTFLWSELQQNLDNIINKTLTNDLEKKQIIYRKLSNELKKINKTENQNYFPPPPCLYFLGRCNRKHISFVGVR